MKSLPWALGAAVAVAALVLFRDAAFGGRLPSDTIGTSDVSFVGTVLEQAGAQVRAGTVPLWFPEFDCGTPLAAAWMYGLLSPGTLLFAAFPLGIAWALTVAVHLGWGAAGMTSLLQRRGCCAAGAVGGALLFAFSEYMIGRSTCGHLNLVLPVAWAPWVLRWIHGCVQGERRAVPLLAMTLAAGLLAGHLQVWFYLGPLAALYAVAEAWGAAPRAPAFRRLAGGAALALGIAAAQIAITAEFVSVAAPVAEDRQVVFDVSAPPALALSKPFLAIEGAEPPPGALDPRPESRGIAGIWVFGLAALGFARGASRRWVLAGAAAFAIVASMGLRTPVSAWVQDVPPFSFSRAPARFLVVTVLVVPILAAHGISGVPGVAGVRAAVAAAAALLALVLGTPAVVSVSDAMHRQDVVSALPAEIRRHRVHAPTLCQWANVEAQGLATLRTPCFVGVKGYAELVATPSPAIAYWLDLGAGLEPELEPGPYGPVSARNLAIDRFDPMGAARFFGEAVAGRADADVLARLRRGERTLFVDGAAPGPGGTGSVKVASRSARELRLDVESSGPGWLLVSAKLYPGWTFTVDGAAAEVRRGNLAFPAVRIPSGGRHAVGMTYEPASFRIGVVISALSLAAALLLALRDRRVGSPG